MSSSQTTVDEMASLGCLCVASPVIQFRVPLAYENRVVEGHNNAKRVREACR